MRHAIFALTLLASPAWAEDVTVQAPVTAAEIYLQGALITRSASVDLPAGTHRVLIPHVLDGETPRLSVTGASLGAVELLSGAIVDGRQTLTDGQRAAYDAWQAAVEAEQQAGDARLRAAAALASAEDALAVLRSMSGGNLTQLQPDAVGPFAAAVSSNVSAAETARANARAALRTAERAARDASLAAGQAKRDFEATSGTLGAVSLMAVGVALDAPGPVTIEMGTFTRNAGWSPRYDIDLDADAAVTFERKAVVYQNSGLPFVDVALTLSTVDPFAQLAPRPVDPNQAALSEPRSLSRSGGIALEAAPEVAADFARAAPAPAEGPLGPQRQALTANTDGVVVTYDYPIPVSLAPTGDPLDLALDPVTLEARVFNRAAVRFDSTAFLMAEITNTIGEPILPGPATYYREGQRIGEGFQPLIPAGDEADLSFGPQQFLRVDFAVLENQEGDRGLFTTSGTRRQDIVFRIRNLSGEAAEVEARYALPFSELEDLEIAIDATPQPQIRDVDDAQGVSDWVLDVPPGGDVAVALGVQLEWPEGRTLIWTP